MSRRFCRQFLPHQILAVWQNAVPVSCDRAPAGGFLVRRLQVFFTGSKGRTVKARVAARRGSLDRLPAFGTFAGVTDEERGDSSHAESLEMPCLVQSRFVMNYARRYAMLQKTALPASRVDAGFPWPCAKP